MKNGKIMPRLSTLSHFLTSTTVTLKIANNKTHRIRETIPQQTTNTPECLIKILTHHVYHILSNNGSVEKFICDYCTKGKWFSIASNDIIQLVRAATKQPRLRNKPFIMNSLVSSRYKRAVTWYSNCTDMTTIPL